MLSIAERHKYILDSLNKHGFVRITDVANELGVTKVTIRKDIKILESKGLLYKVHGSARPANPHVADLDVHVKDNINRDAKRRIAQRAAEMLGETDSIIVASGSTVYAFAEEIKMRMWHHLNIVTPFLRLGVLLNESENVNVVQLGGSVHKKSLSVLGEEAAPDGTRFYRVRAAFNGAQGYMPVSQTRASVLAGEGVSGYAIMQRPGCAVYRSGKAESRLLARADYQAVRVLGS